MCDDLNCLVDRILSAARKVAEDRQRRAEKARLECQSHPSAGTWEQSPIPPPDDNPASGGAPQSHWIWQTLDEL